VNIVSCVLARIERW